MLDAHLGEHLDTVSVIVVKKVRPSTLPLGRDQQLTTNVPRCSTLSPFTLALRLSFANGTFLDAALPVRRNFS